MSAIAEIAWQSISLSFPSNYFSLKTLKEAGLISPRQQGRWMYYSLNLSQFIVLEQYLAEFRRHGVIAPRRNCQ